MIIAIDNYNYDNIIIIATQSVYIIMKCDHLRYTYRRITLLCGMKIMRSYLPVHWDWLVYSDMHVVGVAGSDMRGVGLAGNMQGV